MKIKGQVYKSMLWSYIVILLIPVIVTVIAYSYTYYRVKEQAEFYLGNLMSTVRNISDREMAYYKNFLIQLKLDETVRTLATGSFDESPDEYWGTYLIKEKLQLVYGTMRDSSVFCKDIFVYLTEADKVIGRSSGADLDTYSSLYYEEDKTEQLRETLKKGSMEDVICHQDKNGKTYVLLLETMLNIYGQRGNAVAGLWLDVELLDSRIQSTSWEGGIDWGLLDAQNNFLRMPDKFAVETIEFESKDEAVQTIHLDGEKYFIDTMHSEEYDWTYVLFIPEKYISTSTNRLLYLYLGSIVIVLALGYWSAKAFSRYHYNPLKNILKIFNKGLGEEVNNEYQYLEAEVIHMLDRYKNYQRHVSESDKVMRKYVLKEMLTTASVEKMEIAVCEEVYRKFRDKKNVVLIAHLKNSDINGTSLLKDRNLDYFTVMNVYEEGIGEAFPVEVIEVSGRVVVIADITSCDEKYTESLQAIHEILREFLQQHFQLSVSILEGGSHPAIAGIHQSYLEACEAEGFLQYQDDSYIRYEDIKELKVRRYDYSFDVEERLFNAIRAGDDKLACSYVANIVENNFNKNTKASPDMLTCLLYDVFGTLIKASEDSGIKHVKMQTIESISFSSGQEEIITFFSEMIHEICKEAEKRGTYGEVLCQRVFDFICKNYTDPELNAAQTALHFNMTPSYLSYVYKKQMGESIADVIKKMRMKYATTLLREGMSVVEVSQKVGYRECSTFIRTFKSCTGITPGKIKELAENEQISEKKNS